VFSTFLSLFEHKLVLFILYSIQMTLCRLSKKSK